MIPVSLILLIALKASFGGTVKGTVFDTYENKPVTRANVMIHGLEVMAIPPGKAYGAAVDRNGSFEIKEIPVGTYIFRVSSLGYVSYTDTISLTASDQVLVKNIPLEPALAESPPAREQYHQRLAEENAKQPILTIRLESHTLKDGFLTINPSVNNSSTLPIVLLRINECINPITPIVKDITGKTLKPNLFYTDCMGKSIPDLADTIEVQPSQTVEYPPVLLELYDFKRLPQGKYSIWLKYRFHKPRRLSFANFRPDYRTKYESEIETLTTVLRGEFLSSNSIIFENKP